MYFMNFKYAIDKAEGMVADIKPFKYKEINNIDLFKEKRLTIQIWEILASIIY